MRLAATRNERGMVTTQVAGIRKIGAPVEMIEVSEPRPLAPDEVLVEVAAAGVGNWDEFVRTGGWAVGGGPPPALGVEAAGTVLAVGDAVADGSPESLPMPRGRPRPPSRCPRSPPSKSSARRWMAMRMSSSWSTGPEV